MHRARPGRVENEMGERWRPDLRGQFHRRTRRRSPPKFRRPAIGVLRKTPPTAPRMQRVRAIMSLDYLLDALETGSVRRTFFRRSRQNRRPYRASCGCEAGRRKVGNAPATASWFDRQASQRSTRSRTFSGSGSSSGAKFVDRIARPRPPKPRPWRERRGKSLPAHSGRKIRIEPG